MNHVQNIRKMDSIFHSDFVLNSIHMLEMDAHQLSKSTAVIAFNMVSFVLVFFLSVYC